PEKGLPLDPKPTAHCKRLRYLFTNGCPIDGLYYQRRSKEHSFFKNDDLNFRLHFNCIYNIFELFTTKRREQTILF
ncbi:MAG: hypothetical protein LWX02_07885, partial [Deltaproteobacteria bacterium]|nr:hypothetical protein [Deltaproteobacteria bacterium]MDL1988223.1 hypothetical protein [Deltaproteobacteria bacterium]